MICLIALVVQLMQAPILNLEGEEGVGVTYLSGVMSSPAVMITIGGECVFREFFLFVYLSYSLFLKNGVFFLVLFFFLKEWPFSLLGCLNHLVGFILCVTMIIH